MRISPALPVLAAVAFFSLPLRAAETENQKFDALVENIWEWSMREYPEWATSLGKREGLDRWTDESAGAIARRDARTREVLAELKKIDPAKLDDTRRLDLELLIQDYQRSVEAERFPGELLALDQLGGVHQGIAQLMEDVPAERPEDFDAILARYRAWPALVDQNIALLQRGLEAGVTPPRVTLASVPAQFDALLADESIDNPILAPFRKPAPLLTEDQREHYRARAIDALETAVLPAMRKFREFVVGTYLPGARESIGMAALPDGEAWYAFNVRSRTTSDLTPEQIHAIGLSEVARIGSEMDALRERIGFEGGREAFAKFLRTDPRFFYKSADDLLAGYRSICKSVDPELPRFFGKLPRLPYGVKAVPDYAASSSPTAYYQGGSEHAGRPGWFFANASHLEQRPKWEMEALALHEAVPGHHLQIALAQEQEEKHELLRERGYTAFIEGWGLYAERLGKEMGCYTDPYSDYGRLAYEMWRAARLVVDTGIHAMGWTRDQAVEYFRKHTALSDHNIKVEVDRYIVWPGQALAYKIGELKILSLRHRAEKALGDAFDIRAFHDTVLAVGAVPLDVLEKRVDAWIAGEKPATP